MEVKVVFEVEDLVEKGKKTNECGRKIVIIGLF